MQRVPAAWIAKGLGGWKFPKLKKSEFHKLKRLALVIMTMQSWRKNGHIGGLKTPVKNGKIAVMVVAGSHGVVAVYIWKSPDCVYYAKSTMFLQVLWVPGQ